MERLTGPGEQRRAAYNKPVAAARPSAARTRKWQQHFETCRGPASHPRFARTSATARTLDATTASTRDTGNRERPKGKEGCLIRKIPHPISDSVVNAILEHHGIHAPWLALRSTGVANWIFATQDVVLRVSTDHTDAVPDARTESVAAPVARTAGIPVPALIAFDDSRALVDRPYSLWERIHGETLGMFAPHPEAATGTWRAVGVELARLHSRITSCADPNRWLDEPGRVLGLEALTAEAASKALISRNEAVEIESWTRALRPLALVETERRFLHNDIHPMNVMCTRDDTLLAIIDWGDSGWGDPVLEFAQVPVRALPYILAGYSSEAHTPLGEGPEARIVWDKLGAFLEDLLEHGASRHSLHEIRRFTVEKELF
ncbi:MAG TPA: aminoglycoside phosphotransferase family protein [Pirellulaceae bacterium]|nr:aminoglycoside phosphotransferase family protein [Pirellulaceae bacterium]